MKSYTKEQSETLIRHFTPLLVDKPFFGASKIISLTRDELIDGKFMIRVNGSVDTSTLIAPFSWLEPIIEKFGLPSTDEVLKEKGL